jgi:NADH-quinone oxidoreductase subunit J
VASALFLLVTLGSIAALFVLLSAQFIAVLQVIVYIGAILVLFLFVIMLLNLGYAYRPDLKRPPWRLVAGGIGVALLAELALALAPVRAWPGPGPEALEALQRARGVIGSVAQLLFSDYLVPFEVTSILLLVAIVGALTLAKRRLD